MTHSVYNVYGYSYNKYIDLYFNILIS